MSTNLYLTQILARAVQKLRDRPVPAPTVGARSLPLSQPVVGQSAPLSLGEVLKAQAAQHQTDTIPQISLENYRPGMIPQVQPVERTLLDNTGSVTAQENIERAIVRQMPEQPQSRTPRYSGQRTGYLPAGVPRITRQTAMGKGAGAYVPVGEIEALKKRGVSDADVLRHIQDTVAAQVGLSPQDVQALTQKFGQHPLANITEPGSDTRSSLESILRQGRSAGGKAEFKVSPELVALLHQEKRGSLLNPVGAAIAQIQDEERSQHQEWLNSLEGKTQQLAAGIGHGGSLGHFAGSAVEKGNRYAQVGQFIGDLGTRSLLQVGGVLAGGVPGEIAGAMLPAFLRASAEHENGFDLESRIKEAVMTGAATRGANSLLRPFAGAGKLGNTAASAVAYPVAAAVVEGAVNHRVPDPRELATQTGIGVAMGVLPHIFTRRGRTSINADAPQVRRVPTELPNARQRLRPDEAGLVPGVEMVQPGMGQQSRRALPPAAPPRQAHINVLPSSGEVIHLPQRSHQNVPGRAEVLLDIQRTRAGQGALREDGSLNSPDKWLPGVAVTESGGKRILSPSASVLNSVMLGEGRVMDGGVLKREHLDTIIGKTEELLKEGKVSLPLSNGESSFNVDLSLNDVSRKNVETYLGQLKQFRDQTGDEGTVFVGSMPKQSGVEIGRMIATARHEKGHVLQNVIETKHGKWIDIDAADKALEADADLKGVWSSFEENLAQDGYDIKDRKSVYQEIESNLLGGSEHWRDLGLDPKKDDDVMKAFLALKHLTNRLDSTHNNLFDAERDAMHDLRVHTARPGTAKRTLGKVIQDVRTKRASIAGDDSPINKGGERRGGDAAVRAIQRSRPRSGRGGDQEIEPGIAGEVVSQRSKATADRTRRKRNAGAIQKQISVKFSAPKKRNQRDQKKH